MRLPYFIIFQVLSLVMALIYLKHLRKLGLLVMVPLLFLVCTVELVATNNNPNIEIYNFYIMVSPLFYSYLFIRILQMKSAWKKMYIIMSVFLGIFFIWDYFFINRGQFNYYSMAISMIAYIILSFIALVQMVSDDTRHVSLTREPYFWIATGIIVFSIVTIVITGLHTYIVENKIQIAGKNIQRVIMPMVNVILYSCFAYSFYLCKNYSAKVLVPGSKK